VLGRHAPQGVGIAAQAADPGLELFVLTLLLAHPLLGGDQALLDRVALEQALIAGQGKPQRAHHQPDGEHVPERATGEELVQARSAGRGVGAAPR